MRVSSWVNKRDEREGKIWVGGEERFYLVLVCPVENVFLSPE